MLTLAQQFIDASNDGGAAFIFFAIMCFIFVGVLFAVDSLRRRAVEKEDERSAPRGG